MHLFKCFAPTSTRFRGRSYDQLPLLDFQIDGTVQVTLLDDGFWNPDPSGIPDLHDARLHFSLLRAMF